MYMVNQWANENIVKKSIQPKEKIEVKEGYLIKKWELGEWKKKILYMNKL